MNPNRSRLAAWGPRLAVACLCVGLLVCARSHRGHGFESMDVRTYAQMVRGVALSGLPAWDNGPIDRFEALVVPWGIPVHGRIWGIYGALYPYLAAPAYLLGSIEGVSVFTFALLAPLAFVTFLLAKRFVQNEWFAALAGGMVVLSTPLMGKALEISAFPLAALMTTTATYCAVRMVDADAPARTWGFLAGLAWAGAGATHALGFPMAAVGLVVAAVVPGWPEGASLRERAAKRSGPLAAGFLLGVAPVAWLNHVRFGSLNPVSYGPVPWTGIVVDSLRFMTAAHELKYAAPVLALFAAVAGGLYAARNARKRALWMGGVLIAGAVLSLLVPVLRERLFRMGVMTYALIVDLTLVDMAPYYTPAPGGVGWLFAHHVPRATLQCTPALVLAPFMLVRERLRWRSALLLLPSAGFYASLIMRAEVAYFDAIGWPWVYIRYTLLAVPLLVVAAVAVLDDLGLTWIDVGLGIATAVAMALAFDRLGNEESSVARRVMIVVLPLVLAGVAFAAVAVAVWRRAEKPWPARGLAALVVGAGFAIGICSDYQANAVGKRGCDAFADMVANATPERFAVIGTLGQFEIIAGLSTVRDVQYADLLRVPGQDLSTMRPLVDYWRAEGRPIFMFSPHPPQGWPDMSYTPMPANDLYRMDFQGDTNAAR